VFQSYLGAAQAKRGRLGCLLHAPEAEPQEGLVSLLAAKRMRLHFVVAIARGRRFGQEQARCGGWRKTQGGWRQVRSADPPSEAVSCPFAVHISAEQLGRCLAFLGVPWWYRYPHGTNTAQAPISSRRFSRRARTTRTVQTAPLAKDACATSGSSRSSPTNRRICVRAPKDLCSTIHDIRISAYRAQSTHDRPGCSKISRLL
jgi:hypothetical protein